MSDQTIETSDQTVEDGAAPAEAEEPGSRGLRIPTPLGILALVTVLVWLLALFIPSGQYQLSEEGYPIAGSFQQVPSPLDFRGRVTDLLLAPINGLYGIQDPETGQVGPFNRGALFGSAQVFLFILAIGGFMTVVFQTGALDLGISRLAHAFQTRGTVLIVTLSVRFGILGSVMSWSDETLGFYALIVPLILRGRLAGAGGQHLQRDGRLAPDRPAHERDPHGRPGSREGRLRRVHPVRHAPDGHPPGDHRRRPPPGPALLTAPSVTSASREIAGRSRSWNPRPFSPWSGRGSCTTRGASV
jgi:C4-dicarboxylate anaerobic carrier